MLLSVKHWSNFISIRLERIQLFWPTFIPFLFFDGNFFVWNSECGRWYFSPPGDGYGPGHRPQRHALLLHHRREPGPDLSHGPHDRRDGDTAGASRPRAPAGVHTHRHRGRRWDAAAVGKFEGTAGSSFFRFFSFAVVSQKRNIPIGLNGGVGDWCMNLTSLWCAGWIIVMIKLQYNSA